MSERRHRSGLDTTRLALATAAAAALSLTACEKGVSAFLLFAMLGWVALGDLIALVGIAAAMTMSERRPGAVQISLSLLCAGVVAWAVGDTVADVYALDRSWSPHRALSLFAFLGVPIVLWPLWLVVLRVHRGRADRRSRAAIHVGFALSVALVVAAAVYAYLYFWAPYARANAR